MLAIILLLVSSIWAYIIIIAAETGYNQGWNHGPERYSNYNIVKWLLILKRNISKPTE